MAFVPIPRVVSFQAIWQQQGEAVENTFHYHFGADVTEAMLDGLANTYSTWAGAHVGLFDNFSGLVKMEARDLTTATSLRKEYNVVPSVVGTDASGSLPNNVTFALKRQTGLAGRKNRGRIYLIGLSKDRLQADGQRLATAQANGMVVAYDALMNQQFTDNAADEVIAHKSLGTFTHVVSYAYTDLVLDSQRRRLPAHNRHH